MWALACLVSSEILSTKRARRGIYKIYRVCWGLCPHRVSQYNADFFPSKLRLDQVLTSKEILVISPILGKIFVPRCCWMSTIPQHWLG